MSKIRVAINGFGRIGRVVTRCWLDDPDLPDVEIVGINDLADAEQMAHLLRYDSVHGRFPHEVRLEGDTLHIGSHAARYTSIADPAQLPWKELGVDIVLECTGLMLKRELALKHIEAGAKRVLLSAPPKGEGVPTIVLGVNEKTFDPANDLVVSNASCTTNCLAPLAHVLHEEFGMERGLMVTVHSYTNDQNMHDSPHKKDWRRARAGGLSMIPTSTGAAKAVGLVLPHLKGRLTGYAVRVPTPNVSLVDLTVQTRDPVSVESINDAVKKRSQNDLDKILRWTDEPLVSRDLLGDPHSCIFDSLCTQVADDHLAKVVAWYDNEVGYSYRLIELAAYVGRHI